MKKDKINLLALVLLLMLPMLASCRKELCYNHYCALDVSLAWEKEWERDYGMSHASTWDPELHGCQYHDLRPEMPEWVNLVKYSSDNAPSEKSISADGGQIILDNSSDQHFLLYNGDTEYIILSDLENAVTAKATTTPRSRSALAYMMERHPGARSINPPDVLFASVVSDVPQVGVHETKQIGVTMQPLVYTYLIRYEFETGQEHIYQARGALGGMAESVFLQTGKTSDENAIILYDCKKETYGCSAIVRSFGIPGFPDKYYGRADEEPSSDQKFSLNLEVLLKNGKILSFNHDITDQIANQPRGGVIKVSGIRIEQDQVLVESGFNVDLSDWGENHEEVDLPIDEIEIDEILDQ